MTSPETPTTIAAVIEEIGNPKSVRQIPDFGDRLIAIAENHHSAVLARWHKEQMVDYLWPLVSTFGNIQIRGRKETGLYIFDLSTQTMTGSPVRDVLRVAQDASGNTCALVYGNVLGEGHDDMYAWISTTDGSRMHVGKIGGNADENPINHAPDGFEIMAA